MASCLRILLQYRFRLSLRAPLVCALFAVFTVGASASSNTSTELPDLDQEIHLMRGRLAQVAAELRDAKLLAAEKLLEFEAARDQYQLDNNQVNANTMDHSQQRLALAEMGVESRSAKFDRIQKRLEELAQLRQQALPPQPEPQTRPSAVEPRVAETTLVETPAATDADMGLNPGAERLAATGAPTSMDSETPATPVNAQKTEPVISVQGKITDTLELNAQLQKLERHLMATGTAADPRIQVKAYGTAIPGELLLSPLGGNQYFARFIAPVGQVSLILGARLQEYHRNRLELEFLPQEQGEEFVVIFDLNQPENARALVFPETLMFEQKMFAAHSDY